MQFHNYIEQVLGNKVAVSLLRTMIKYQGKVFTIRGLANTANVSANETALTIHDFEKLGIVRVQPVGRAHQLSLNKKNYILSKIIEPIFDSEKRTLEELLQILKKHLDKKKVVISAALFGSVVKGEEKKDSDIDLLIISNDFEAASEVVSTAVVEVIEMFQSELAPIIFTERKFTSKKNSDLAHSIIENYIMVCGKDLVSIIK